MLILRGALETHRGRRPVAGDVVLLIEVADSSLKIDTGAKLAAYARAGIPVYWVINLRDWLDPRLCGARPLGGAYASASTVGPDGSIPLVLDGVPIALIPASKLL